MESVHSIRFLYQHFLSGITTKSLNTFYHACSYAKVDYSHFMNITAKVALRMIPDSLATQPIFLCVDDTMVAKAGTRFENVSIETSYYEQKTFWSLCSYMVRSCKGIEMLVNLINICYCAMTKALKQLIRQQVY